jgi:hypothetical protein
MLLKILNKRERKKLTQKLSEEYGVSEGIFEKVELLTEKQDVWASSPHCLRIPLEGLNIKSIGMQIMRDGKPTIAGIQAYFQTAEKTELTLADAEKFINRTPVKCHKKIASYQGHPIDACKKTGDAALRQ